MAGDASRRPKVSIIIPVYNGSKYLAEAIESALAQMYENKEVIVVNDGSKDEGRTEAVAKGFGDKIRYFAKENGGVASALNMGIQKATGEYISWLSHDDAYMPDKLETQIDFLSKRGFEHVILYGSFCLIDKDSRVFRKFIVPSVSSERFYQALLCERVFTGIFFPRKFGLNGCTTLIPKAAFEKVGLFDEKLRTTQDYDMWFRMNRYFDFVHMDGCFLKSRIHEEQGIRTMKDIATAEVNSVFSKAVDYYQKGDKKFDLELSKTAFALRMSPRKREAYKKAIELARKDRPIRDSRYYMLARIWTPRVARAYSLLERGLERIESSRQRRSFKQ